MKKTHLMYEHTPFSSCGWYVNDYKRAGMKQVFKIEETTCQNCIKNYPQFKLNTENHKKGKK